MLQTQIYGHRILIVSDIHFAIDEHELKLLQGSYTDRILLGDIPKYMLPAVLNKNTAIGVLGNHDTPDVFEGYTIQNLHNATVNIGGITVAGLEGSSRYKMSPNVMHTQDEIKEAAKALPAADILIAHDSPWHQHDTCVSKEGFVGITKYIRKKKPKLMLYGHHHERCAYKLKKTLCICVYRIGIIEPDGTYHTAEEYF